MVALIQSRSFKLY